MKIAEPPTRREESVAKSLAGMTVRWKFDDGPTAGTTYEHTFRKDGTVVFRDVARSDKPSKDSPGPSYASFEVAPATHLISYLSEDSGYTLTVALNFETQKCFGVASNGKEWFPLTGTLETD